MGLKTAIKIRRIDGGLAARRRARSVRPKGRKEEEEGLANDVRSDQPVGPTHQRARLRVGQAADYKASRIASA